MELTGFERTGQGIPDALHTVPDEAAGLSFVFFLGDGSLLGPLDSGPKGPAAGQGQDGHEFLEAQALGQVSAHEVKAG